VRAEMNKYGSDECECACVSGSFRTHKLQVVGTNLLIDSSNADEPQFPGRESVQRARQAPALFPYAARGRRRGRSCPSPRVQLRRYGRETMATVVKESVWWWGNG